MQAITTHYNGYKFRSRLEARWAVFFGTLRIRYQYEPEGFVLQDGTTYLPDFYLPDYNAWCEIKPTPANSKAYGLKEFDYKTTKFAEELLENEDAENSGKSVYLLYGAPHDYYGIIYKSEYAHGAYLLVDYPYEWLMCPYCGVIEYVFSGELDRLDHSKNCESIKIDHDVTGRPLLPDLIEVACNRSKQARFEHGEHPK